MYFVTPGVTESPYNFQYIPAGPLVVRVLKTTPITCDTFFNLTNIVCYNAQYNSGTAFTVDTDIERFSTAAENNITSAVYFI